MSSLCIILCAVFLVTATNAQNSWDYYANRNPYGHRSHSSPSSSSSFIPINFNSPSKPHLNPSSASNAGGNLPSRPAFSWESYRRPVPTTPRPVAPAAPVARDTSTDSKVPQMIAEIQKVYDLYANRLEQSFNDSEIEGFAKADKPRGTYIRAYESVMNGLKKKKVEDPSCESIISQYGTALKKWTTKLDECVTSHLKWPTEKATEMKNIYDAYLERLRRFEDPNYMCDLKSSYGFPTGQKRRCTISEINSSANAIYKEISPAVYKIVKEFPNYQAAIKMAEPCVKDVQTGMENDFGQIQAASNHACPDRTGA